MSRPVKFYPGPNRTTIRARTRKRALKLLRAFPLEYETYGMMSQGPCTGNFGVDSTCIRMAWWSPNGHPRGHLTLIRRKYART